MYCLIERVMNGTVTVATCPIGIEAQTFDEAKGKVKGLLSAVSALVETDDATCLSYVIPGVFPCHGVLTNKPMTLL